MGLVAYNPSNTSTALPEGFHLPGEWKYYEDDSAILGYLINGPLIVVEVPARGAEVAPLAQTAFDAYWANEDASRNQVAEPEIQETPETVQPRRKGGKVRDTSSDTTDSVSEKEA